MEYIKSIYAWKEYLKSDMRDITSLGGQIQNGTLFINMNNKNKLLYKNSFGIYYNNKMYYMDLSTQNFLKPWMSEEKIKMIFTHYVEPKDWLLK
jgi:hypothetical protein